MEKYVGINSVINVKRKNFEEFNDDFSHFPPAQKIRRLNVEVPPIVEGNTDLTMENEQVIPKNITLDGAGDQLMVPDIEELPASLLENEERAIVLYNPMNNPLAGPTSRFSIDPSLIASFKRQALRSVNVKTTEQSEKDDEELAYADNEVVNACRAVIPWAPSHIPSPNSEVSGSQGEVSELDAMDAEEPEATTMDIEDSGAPDVRQQATDYYQPTSQWEQTHCMFPQPPQNTVTPIVWYR